MDVYCRIFDELPRNENVDYTFTRRDDTFLIYAFFKNDEVCALQVLDEINLIANKFNLNGFWMKRSLNIPKNEEECKHIFVFRAIDIVEYVPKLA